MWLFRAFFRTHTRDTENSNTDRNGPQGQVGADAPSRPVRPRLSLQWRCAKLFANAFGACLVVGAAWFGALMFYYTIKYPDPFAVTRDGGATTIRILARDGSLLAQRGSAHPFLPVDMLPSHVIDAVISTEDRRFFMHHGVDPLGLARATLVNMRAGHFVQGGSTLTQQLAKNLFLSSERTLDRKFDEVALAIWLELRLSKTEILELYLNRVYFGAGAYGIEAAAQRYFGKSARALNIPEAALIAGLLKAPSRYAPTRSPGVARARGRAVLRKMHAAGAITDGQLQSALQQPVRFLRVNTAAANDGYGYAVDYVLARLPAALDTTHPEIIIETTLNAPLQRYAAKVVKQALQSDGRRMRATNGAVVVMDMSGGIRALVGGRDYKASQFNRAIDARRQPGSTFKPFVFLAAIENGDTPATIAHDSPVRIGGWAPRNADGKYRGPISLRSALAHSSNSVAVRLMRRLGPNNVAQTARRLGVKSPLRPELSLALGTSEISLLELARSYGVFANGGRALEPHIIKRIRTSRGRILFARPAAPERELLTPAAVGAMSDMLSAVITNGTGRRAALEHHAAAGKTGTSQGFKDAWFVGYTAHRVAGVWIGNDDGTPMRNVTGGGMPARLWHKIMTQAHTGVEPLALPFSRQSARHVVAQRAHAQPEPLLAQQTRQHASTASVVPPVPVRSPRRPRYPTARISNSFVADVLQRRPGAGAVPLASPKGGQAPARTKRLATSPPRRFSKGFMALGAGLVEQGSTAQSAKTIIPNSISP